MIRIRRASGQTVDLPEDARFVELTDLRGRLGVLLILREDRTDICHPEDAVFRKYAASLQLPTTPVREIPASAISG